MLKSGISSLHFYTFVLYLHQTAVSSIKPAAIIVILIEGNATTMDHARVNESEIDSKNPNRKRRAGVGTTLKVLGSLVVGGVVVTGAAACAPGEVGASPSVSAPANPGEATPTPSKTPEATAPATEHKFSGTVNYDALLPANWDEMNELDQQVACTEFFATNIEGEPTLTAFSTGVEVAQWFKNRLLVVQDLVLDKSDPRNVEVAKNLSDCMGLSYIHNEEQSAGQKELENAFTGLANTSIEDMTLVYMEPEQVTRYSDGTFPATAKHNLSYAALAVEGRLNNGFGDVPGQLVMNYFQWSPDENVYRFVLTTPTEDAGVNPYFGTEKAPIVLDPTRQDAPNTLDNSSFEG